MVELIGLLWKASRIATAGLFIVALVVAMMVLLLIFTEAGMVDRAFAASIAMVGSWISLIALVTVLTRNARRGRHSVTTDNKLTREQLRDMIWNAPYEDTGPWPGWAEITPTEEDIAAIKEEVRLGQELERGEQEDIDRYAPTNVSPETIAAAKRLVEEQPTE